MSAKQSQQPDPYHCDHCGARIEIRAEMALELRAFLERQIHVERVEAEKQLAGRLGELEKKHAMSVEQLRAELRSEQRAQVSKYEWQIKERDELICKLTAQLDQVQAAQSELHAHAHELTKRAEKIESQLGRHLSVPRGGLSAEETRSTGNRTRKLDPEKHQQVAGVLKAIETLKRAVEETCWKVE